MISLTFELSPEQVAQVVAANAAPATPVTPVTPAPSKMPATASDGTKLIVGSTLSALDGARHNVTIHGLPTAIFPFVVPAVAVNAQIKLTHFQTDDNTNATPRVGYISRVPGDLSNQWMFTGGVATLTCIVDGGNTVDSNKGLTPHMSVGDTWYLMFQNRAMRNGVAVDSTGSAAADCSVKAQPGS